MQLILAIDSDPRRSEQLANLVRSRLQVDLVQATSAGEGLHALRERVPDLILTSPLLSPFDDGVLDEYLRDLGAAATHVQTLRIPMLSTGPKKKSAANRLFALGRKKMPTSLAAPDGCDPKVFADEIAHYLTRSLEERSVVNRNEPARPEPSRLEEIAPEPVAQPIDDWGAPEALVQEFRQAAPAAPEPVFEQTHVPGSILDLRTPIVHAPQPRVVEPEPFDLAQGRPNNDFPRRRPVDLAQGRPLEFVQSEPVFAEPERLTYVEPEPVSIIEPERSFDVAQHRSEFLAPERPAYVEPEPLVYIEPEPFNYAQPEPVAYVKEPAPVVREPEPPVTIKPAAISTRTHTPPPASVAAPASGNSASFEAALAAIRAAWEKPVPKAPAPAGPGSPAVGTKPLAGSGEVDLTTDIDALEDVTDSSDDSRTSTRRKVEKPRKRPENPRGHKTQGADGRDDGGVIDLSQFELNNR